MKWIFEGRVYSSLEELSGKTMSEGNVPEPVFTEREVLEYALHQSWTKNHKGISPVKLFTDLHIRDAKPLYIDGKLLVDVGEGAESESEL